MMISSDRGDSGDTISDEKMISAINEGNDIVLAHQEVELQVVLDGLVQLVLRVVVAHHSLPQRIEVDAQLRGVLAQVLDGLEDLGDVVVLRLAVLLLQTEVLLTLLQDLQAFRHVPLVHFVRKSQPCLYNWWVTRAWQSRIKASRLRVVMYLSPRFLIDCCSLRFSTYLLMRSSWSSSEMVGVKFLDRAT
jgi:hypothetical protein